jgi:hypothetical protein
MSAVVEEIVLVEVFQAVLLRFLVLEVDEG